MQPQNIGEQIDAMLGFEIRNGADITSALDVIAKLVDFSGAQRRKDGLEKSLTLINDCLAQGTSPEHTSLLHYFAANAWSALRSLSDAHPEDRWDWEQPEFNREVLHLRHASKEPGFDCLPIVRRCQIATNLGNVLSTVGRFVEALEFWNRAIKYDDSFGMALGNRGYGLINYALALYDECHQHIFMRQACRDLREAIKYDVDDASREFFRRHADKISQVLPEEYIQTTGDLDNFSLGPAPIEQEYRLWCLSNTLFLNPLNDIGVFPLAARDVFTCPSVSVRDRLGPSYHGFFNQMKQEFVSARYLFFEGMRSNEPHFSDREVLLHNTFDYPAYSLALEKVKLAFRSAYSLLDKIAFFINDYFGLRIPERAVNMGTLWFHDQRPNKGIRNELKSFENWPMRGMYWLTKDLLWNDEGYQNAIEPDAQAIRAIRNHAEHKYLKLHESWFSYPPAAGDGMELRDTLAYSMNRRDFEAKSLRMLKMTRAALIYLSLGIHQEERRRKSSFDGKVITVPLSMEIISDADKI